jgi:membrane protein required for colicin V production
MDFQIIDMVIIGLVLFLAIKGLVNGFSKELFNFLGLIGGIAIAARSNKMVGESIIQQNILPEMFTQYQDVIGFVAVFLAIWVLFNILSSMFSTFSSEELSIVSRILGYIIAVARYGFIFTLIVFGFNNANFLKEKFSQYTQKSQIFTPMSIVGMKLLNREDNSTITIENNITTESENNISQENNTSL